MDELSRRSALKALAIAAGVAGSATISGAPAWAHTGGHTALLGGGGGGDGVGPDTGKLTGRLVFPEDPGYDKARLGWNREFNPRPLVIIFCQQSEDVINAITWARTNNVAFRARAGRHALEGWSAVDGGAVIDVSEMQNIKLDTGASTVTVQTGVTQDQVVRALGPAGFAITTGSEVGVGLAGVTLGGGIGQLVRSTGVASDSLIGLDMVVPQGQRNAKAIRVDETQHADLLWACRGGGGGNFGIATSFTFRVHPVSEVSVYQLTWNWQHLTTLFTTWQGLAPAAEDGLGSVFNAKTKANGNIYCNGIYRESQEKLKAILKPLLDIGNPAVTIETKPYHDAWSTLAGTTDTPQKIHIPSAWVHDLLPDAANRKVHEFLSENPNTDGEIWCLNWGGAVGRTPTGSTAFFHRAPKFYMEWSSPWQNDSDKEYNYNWSERFRKELQPYTRGSYVNVPNRNLADWPTAYYGDNYTRLQKVKTTYDPLEFFQFEQSIKPQGA